MNTLSFVGTITRPVVIKDVQSGQLAEYYVRSKCGSRPGADIHFICFQSLKSAGSVTWARHNLVEGQEVTVIGALSPREFERGGPVGVMVVHACTHGWEVDDKAAPRQAEEVVA